MTASWPAGLPQFVQEQGYSETLRDQSIESPMDAGPPKVRRRFTGNYRPLTWTIRCDAEQAEAFEEFYEVMLAGGTLPFTWVHPRTQRESLFRFRKPPPQYLPFGGTNVAITMQVWELQAVMPYGAMLDFFTVRESGLVFLMGTH